MEAAQNKNGSR